MVFTVKLADMYIQMKSKYPELKEFCKDYLAENAVPDFSVSWTEEEILQEKEHEQTTNFTPIYLETLAALRKISEAFPTYRRFLIHGAAITLDDKAYLFTAPSGTGKSTHIRLWKKHLGDRVDIVNGDKPFVSLDLSESGHVEPRIYGTPWAGKENWQKNRSAPLGGICFLRRGKENKIRKLAPTECLQLLFNQVYLPKDEDAAQLTLALVDQLVQKVPLYLLECDISEGAVKCSFEGMTGLKYE